MLKDLCETKRELLIEIKCLFGLNQDSSKYLEDYLSSSSSNESDIFQENIVCYILNDQILSKYKPSWKYRKSFLKKIISILERQNYEINSHIYNQYIQIINDPEYNSDKFDQKYFVTYFLKEKESKPIIIEQYESAITNGTTGLHIWPACFQLINFLKKETSVNLLEEKIVLELGSGVGLLGLHCLNTNRIKHYSFTDCHDVVLKQIESNILLNYDKNLVGLLNSKAENKLVSINHLNWFDPDESKLFENNYNRNLDIILATDIIFDPDLIPALVKTLSFIWSNQNDSKRLKFLIASTIRNDNTYKIFLDNLDKENFKYDILEKNHSTTKSSTPDCFIEILKIFK